MSSNENEMQPNIESKPSGDISVPYHQHHIAIRTRNIENAISFYSLLDFKVEHKFRAGPARAAWLTASDSNKYTRIELIEVPNHILQEEEGTRQRALDLMTQEHLLGLNHFALDVTEFTNAITLDKDDDASPNDKSRKKEEITYALDKYLNHLNSKSLTEFRRSIRVAVPPQQKIIGKNVYELAFLYDADGSIVELLYHVSELEFEDEESMDSGWTPWDGKGFRGFSDEESR